MVGPGIGSARSNRAASSVWQKYWVRNSSGRQAIWAPRSAAWRSIVHARRRLSSGSVEHRIWIRPTVNGRGSGSWRGFTLDSTIGQASVRFEHRNGAVKFGRDASSGLRSVAVRKPGPGDRAQYAKAPPG